MTGVVLRTINECNHLKIIPVISSFDSKGNIVPLYIRVDGESMKIYNPFLVESTYERLTYQCDVLNWNRVKSIKLSYHIEKHVWSLVAK